MRITRTIGIISIGLVVAFAATVRAAEQKVIPLYEGAAPGSEAWTQKEVEFRDGAGKAMVGNVTTPTLTAFLPDAATSTGTAVVVCPGGGFRFLSWQSEGTEVVEWLQRRGVAAFVLKYRLKQTPADEGAFGREMIAFFLSLGRPKNGPGPEEANKAMAEDLQKAAVPGTEDGRQAIRLVRRHAEAWGIKPDRIGMHSFTAGWMNTAARSMDPDPESPLNFA